MEATWGWYWAADVIPECGARLHLAHPLGIAGYSRDPGTHRSHGVVEAPRDLERLRRWTRRTSTGPTSRSQFGSAPAGPFQLLHLVAELGDPRRQTRQCLHDLVDAHAFNVGVLEHSVQLHLLRL